MYKKIYFTIATLFILGLSCSYGATIPGKPVILKNIQLDGKIVEKKTGTEIYYVWVLGNNGCFYLYRVVVIDNILEFWTPMGPSSWAGNTVNCVYGDEEMASIC